MVALSEGIVKKETSSECIRHFGHSAATSIGESSYHGM